MVTTIRTGNSTKVFATKIILKNNQSAIDWTKFTSIMSDSCCYYIGKLISQTLPMGKESALICNIGSGEKRTSRLIQTKCTQAKIIDIDSAPLAQED